MLNRTKQRAQHIFHALTLIIVLWGAVSQTTGAVLAASTPPPCTPGSPGCALPSDEVTALQNYPNWVGITGTACGTPTSPTSGPPVSTTQTENQNAQAIIGIAKTENLGENAALIGLMTALDESTLTNDANTNVPLSESNPNKQGDGSSGTSLGIFQQQITDGWSTISSDINNTAAINQLMTPAYAAEAFFGSPSGSNAPQALSKGLQNVPNWQSLAPQVAAQEVQNPGPPNPGNVAYQDAVARFQSQAQSLLSQFWSSAPAVPLPVPFSGSGSGSGPGSISCSTSTTTTCNGGSTTTAGLDSTQQSIVCLAQQELQLWTSGQLKPNTNAYFKYSNGRSEEWCADFASWIYSQANYPLGPAGSNGPSWDIPNVADLNVPPQDGSKFTYHSVAGYTPRPGDLALHSGQHVNIVVAVSGSTITLIGGDQGGNSYPSNVVSEYTLTDPSSDTPPITGYLSPN